MNEFLSDATSGRRFTNDTERLEKIIHEHLYQMTRKKIFDAISGRTQKPKGPTHEVKNWGKRRHRPRMLCLDYEGGS